MKDHLSFVQLAIPGMEKFIAENPTSTETTPTTLKAVENISILSQENQNTFHQLEIPGMEEFLAKPNAQSKPKDLSKYSNSITTDERKFKDCAA
ncbi:hypothetical protein H6G06_02835 [Anabaena sphaerica FACHB-251]|uniref:Uncharacterized protein n=1 Tax=Anabaena sphaerica FACHB-251 TaxID=2692883 RepID=A0A926WDG6_9NOST|nr:hypothetical protein [Anabaena sphaerica]MBD2292443.1 hypothetical protein [Anabaena sphaerica FACHB-251]